jgi:hypothetical protein
MEGEEEGSQGKERRGRGVKLGKDGGMRGR